MLIKMGQSERERKTLEDTVEVCACFRGLVTLEGRANGERERLESVSVLCSYA